jgi:hypothetical protein
VTGSAGTGVVADVVPGVSGTVTNIAGALNPAAESALPAGPGAGTAPTVGTGPAGTITVNGNALGSRMSPAGMPAGLSGTGATMSAGAGGGSPSWPSLPYGNAAPWVTGGQAAGQGAAGGSGYGGGTGLVAVLAAAQPPTIGVLRLRRTNPLRPRSAWLSALEVPG